MMHLVVQETAAFDANNMPGQGDLPCRFEQFPRVIVAGDPRSGLQHEEIRAPDMEMLSRRAVYVI